MNSACDVIPGDSVGDIVLGAPLIVVASKLKENKDLYGVVRVDDGGSAQAAVVLRSERRNMSFHFHRTTQTLERIIVDNLTSTELVYRSTLLSGPARSTTFAHVYDVLGPTFQGSMDTASGVYLLRYPGIEVSFPIPPQYHQEFMARGTHPTKLPDGSIPVAVAITVLRTPGSDPNSNRDVPYAKGKVLAGDDVVFQWDARTLVFVRSQTRIGFGSSPQDVMRRLGCSPRSIYNLVDNRMHIHSSAGALASKGSLMESRLPAYCFNYPLLGIDFIFSGDHKLEKVMLHNPLPWHDTFLKYQRCNFTVKGPWTLLSVPADEGQPSDDRTLSNAYHWTDADDAYAEGQGVRPLISSTHCSNGLVLKIYAFAGIVIYVMPAQQRVVKVLLFEKLLPTGSTRGRSPALVPDSDTNFSVATDAFIESNRGRSSPILQLPSTITKPSRHVDPLYDWEDDTLSSPPPATSVADAYAREGSMTGQQQSPALSTLGSPPAMQERENTVAYSPLTHAAKDDEKEGDDGSGRDDDQRTAASEEDATDGNVREDDDQQEADRTSTRTAYISSDDEGPIASNSVYSVPPPMPSLVPQVDRDDDDDDDIEEVQRDEDEQHDRYTDDFEESSRHHSARSSWAASAHRSPTLPAQQTIASDDISDDRWGPSADDDAQRDPTVPPAASVAAGEVLEDDDEDGDGNDAETTVKTPGSPSPASTQGRDLSPANRSGASSTSASNTKQKKNKKKRR